MQTTVSERVNSSVDQTLPNPFWQALHTEQARFAVGSGLACRYPADVIPFGGVAEFSVEALTALRDLLEPEESLYITGTTNDPVNDRLPEVDGLALVRELRGWQMHFGAQTGLDAPSGQDPEIDTLGASDVPAMLALTDVAFPGFLRSRTYELGSYYGIRLGGELVAMAGERSALAGSCEISAVCTHPAHTGRGYAAVLIQHLLRTHRAAGVHSFLHVAAANERAVSLYERLGFVKTMAIVFHQLRRL
jgi:ribosomal protein S18 acetylase RimI-like enzyme